MRADEGEKEEEEEVEEEELDALVAGCVDEFVMEEKVEENERFASTSGPR